MCNEARLRSSLLHKPTIVTRRAIFAEFACAFAVAAGLFFRLALIPLVITMFVAAFVIHGQDPFQKQELALAYLAAYVGLLLSDAGRYSLDSVMRR